MTTDSKGQTVTGALADRDQRPGKEVATSQAQEVRKFVAQMEVALLEQLPKHIPGEYFIRACVTMLRDDDALAKVAATPRGRASIYVALLEAARFGLMPGTEEGAVVPFKGTATWIPQAQGLVKMMYNTGLVAGVHNRFIHQGDEWDITYGRNGGFFHRPFLKHPDGRLTTAEERGPKIIAYCYLDMKDGSVTPVTLITREDAEFTRDNHSAGYRYAEEKGYRNSTWHTNFDAMWLKTAVRGHAKYAPKSTQLVELLATAARDDVQRPDSAKPPAPADMNAPDLEGEVLSDTYDDAPTDAAPEPPVTQTARPRQKLADLLRELSVAPADRAGICAMLGREMPDDPPLTITSSKDLTGDQVDRVLHKLDMIRRGESDPAKLADGLRSLSAAGREGFRSEAKS